MNYHSHHSPASQPANGMHPAYSHSTAQHPNGMNQPDWNYAMPGTTQPQMQLPPITGGMPTSSIYGRWPTAAPQGMAPAVLPAASSSAQAQSAGGARSFSGTSGKYTYTLQIVQQPQRARMCGFGDKDRRPITPPPCVKLIITDSATGEPVSADDIDGSFFVLQVDLWDKDGDKEVNIVRASGTSPATSISAATTSAYPPPPDRPVMHPSNFGQALQYMQAPDGSYYHQPVSNAYYDPTMFQQQQYQGYQPSQQSMITRNLIGSLAVNAAKLSAPGEKPYFWFVLQDLSVRTEGWFRLKMCFIDLGSAIHSNNGNSINKGTASILAWTYSDKFQVFSAKKFPGVIDSTPLSKEFAKQGIKIPIRKDGTKKEDDED